MILPISQDLPALPESAVAVGWCVSPRYGLEPVAIVTGDDNETAVFEAFIDHDGYHGDAGTVLGWDTTRAIVAEYCWLGKIYRDKNDGEAVARATEALDESRDAAAQEVREAAKRRIEATRRAQEWLEAHL